MELVSVAANTASDVADAALSLISRRVDALCQIPGNLTASAFPAIAQAARRARLPSFVFQTSQIQAGAVAAVARDYHDGGRDAALIAARIMRGENPARIPFVPLTRMRLVVNPAAARAIGFVIPPSILGRAEVFTGTPPVPAAAGTR
jgi:ABC-type uncharacterized transport system substrate-binding protein